MHRFLILSLFILTSCGTSYKIANIQEDNLVSQTIQNPYLNVVKKEYNYRFKITFMKNEMKGIFVVKKLDDTTHRAVMTSDFGNTLFDLSVTKDDFTLHYTMPDLNKKMVVKTLSEDLQTILRNDFEVNQQIKTDNLVILKSDNVSLIYPKNESNYFTELVHLKRNKIKTVNQFHVNESDFPSRIVIKHNHFNLTFELTKVDPVVE